MDAKRAKLFPRGPAEGVFAAGTATLLALYLGQVYLRLPVPGPIFAAVGLVLVGLGLAISPRTAPFWFAAAFLAVGSGLAVFYGLPLGEALPTLADFRTLVGVIVLIPVVGFIFDLRNYGAALLGLAGRWMRGEVGLVGSLGVLGALVSAMTSVAALVVVYQLLRAQAREHERWSRLLSTAVLRGFAASNVWSPSAPATSVALLFSGASFEAFLPVAFGIFLLCLLLHWVFTFFDRGEPRWRPQPTEMPMRVALWQSSEFVILLLLFFGTLLAVERLTGLPLISIVPPVCLAFPVLVFALNGRLGLYGKRLGEYFAHGVPRKSSEITLMLSAGFLVGVLRLSGLSEQFALLFEQGLGATPLLLMLSMPTLMVGLSLVGVPPMVTLLLLAGTVDQAALSLAPAVFAAALTLGVAAGSVLSPFAVPVFVLSSVVGRSTFQVSLGWNWLFGLAYYGLGLALLALLLP